MQCTCSAHAVYISSPWPPPRSVMSPPTSSRIKIGDPGGSGGGAAGGGEGGGGSGAIAGG
eukprot:scaffold36573_cov54-Phaeocystis_antarctica.AAC.1